MRVPKRVLAVVLFCLACAVFPLFSVSAHAAISYTDFSWFIKDAPPSGEPNYGRARTTGYCYALEEDFRQWSSGVKPAEGKTSCTVPKDAMGFYEAVRCEGTGITAEGKLVSASEIKETRDASLPYMVDPSERLRYKKPAPRPRRTIAVINNKDSPYYIAQYSRVYIKYPDANNPYTGWYVAEDSGGGFKGAESYPKIDIFYGTCDASGKSPTVPKDDQSAWPQVWVFPGENTPDLQQDNIITYIMSGAKKPLEQEILEDMGEGLSGIFGGAETSAGGAAAGVAAGASSPIKHPYFNVPYSIDPSFSVSVPFDLSIYERVPEALKVLERCRDDIGCILGNVSAIEAMDPGLNWVVKYAGDVISEDAAGGSERLLWEGFCEPPDLDALSSLAEVLDAAKSSSDSDCMLSYDVEAVPSEGLSVEDMLPFAFGGIPGMLIGVAYFAVDSLLSGSYERVFSFVESQKGLKVYLPGVQTSFVIPGARFKSVDGSLRGESSHEMRYDEDFSGSIFIYKDEDNNLTITPDDPSAKECGVYNKMVKFCVVQNRSVLAYDEVKNKLGIQNLVLKFAYLFKSEVKDVTGFEVLDAKYAANTALISWDAPEGIDLSKFTIYYSENTGAKAVLTGASPSSDVVKEALASDLVALSLGVDVRQEVVGVDLAQEPLCDVASIDGQTCSVEYSLESATEPEGVPFVFENNVLYYSQREGKYFYFLPGLRDGQPYFFAITATDTNGQESPSFTAVEDADYEVSENDLVPGLARFEAVSASDAGVTVRIAPTDYAIDGSYLDPSTVNHFRIYCSASPSDIDLLSAPSFFESGFSVLEDGSVEITADLSKFDAVNCGAEPPMDVYLVIAPVQKQGVEELYYKGTATSMSFSPVVSIPAPTP